LFAPAIEGARIHHSFLHRRTGSQRSALFLDRATP
jgi:hypothetical protein